MSIAEREIDALKEAIGAVSDAQLADMLGYSHGAITQWRNRGKVPEKARRRVAAYKEAGRIGLKMEEKRRELGHQLLYEGRCLALFLAPSCDAADGRFTLQEYEAVLRRYTSFFDEIELACAEEVAERLSRIEGNATDALSSLSRDDRSDLFSRIMQRADQWRMGEAGQTPTLHDKRQSFRGFEGDKIEDGL